MRGFSFTVRYSPGLEDRAHAVARRWDTAVRFLAAALKFTPRLNLLVLSAQDWAGYATYGRIGVPHHTSPDTVVIGGEPSPAGALVSGMVKQLACPTEYAQLVARHGLIEDEGRLDLRQFGDVVSLHELSSIFYEQVPFRFPRQWVARLFAHVCLYAVTAETDRDSLPVLSDISSIIARQPASGLEHRSLADFEEIGLGMDPVNRFWYEFRLAVIARQFYDVHGLQGLLRFYDTFLRIDRELTDSEVMTILGERVAPELGDIGTVWPR